jgi:selenocysteine lyase/cysteine desulfurase
MIAADARRTWQEQFPVTRDWVYLDIANKCPLPRAVKEAWERFLTEMHETPASKDQWKARAEGLRRRIADLVGARPSQIAFTKNTSEGLNIIAASVPFAPADNVVVHAREHPNNLHAWLHLRRRGVEVRVVDSARHDILLDDIAAAIDDATRLVAVSAVSYCTGRRLDLAALSARCRAHDAWLIVDGVQAVGVVPIEVAGLGIDAMACGAQKGLLCTHGLGFLYCRQELTRTLIPAYAARSSLASHDLGARHLDFLGDARRFEHGNLNYGGVHALTAAVELIETIGLAYIEARVRALSGFLIDLLAAKGVSVITPRDWHDRAGIVVFAVDDPARTEAELAAKGFVLSAVDGGVRAAPHFYNTEPELEALVAAL